MGKVSSGQRFNILKRDNFTCRYCGKRASQTELHVDHIRPRTQGGTDHPSNLVTACADCNSGKRDKVVALLIDEGWQSLVGKWFRHAPDESGIGGEGIVISEQGMGYFVVEYRSRDDARRTRRGHRIIHLSAMAEEHWSLYNEPTRLDFIELPREEIHRPELRPTETTAGPVMNALRTGGAAGRSTVELCAEVGIDRCRLHRALHGLKRAGRVERVGRQGKADVWRAVA